MVGLSNQFAADLLRLSPEVYWMNVLEAQLSERTAEFLAAIAALVPELAKEAASYDSTARFPFAGVASCERPAC